MSFCFRVLQIVQDFPPSRPVCLQVAALRLGWSRSPSDTSCRPFVFTSQPCSTTLCVQSVVRSVEKVSLRSVTVNKCPMFLLAQKRGVAMALDMRLFFQGFD